MKYGQQSKIEVVREECMIASGLICTTELKTSFEISILIHSTFQG